MKITAAPSSSWKPSVGFGLQIIELTVVLAGVVQTGGSAPLLANPKAKLLNVTGISHWGARPLAIHAAGRPGDAVFSFTIG
jgi:hypothetical protein